MYFNWVSEQMMASQSMFPDTIFLDPLVSQAKRTDGVFPQISRSLCANWISFRPFTYLIQRFISILLCSPDFWDIPPYLSKRSPWSTLVFRPFIHRIQHVDERRLTILVSDLRESNGNQTFYWNGSNPKTYFNFNVFNWFLGYFSLLERTFAVVYPGL